MPNGGDSDLLDFRERRVNLFLVARRERLGVFPEAAESQCLERRGIWWGEYANVHSVAGFSVEVQRPVFE